MRYSSINVSSDTTQLISVVCRVSGGKRTSPQVEVVRRLLDVRAPIGERIRLEHVRRDLRAGSHDLVDDTAVSLERFLLQTQSPCLTAYLTQHRDETPR